MRPAFTSVAASFSQSALLAAPRPLPARRHISVRCRSRSTAVFSLFGGLFNKQSPEAPMGSSPSKSSSKQGWQPSPVGAAQEPRLSTAGYDITPLTAEEREKQAAQLTEFQRYVTLQAGTERAFTGKTVDGSPHDNKQRGVYVSAIGGLPLFTSDTKFDSGTGWPSFFQPVDPEHIIEVTDTSIPFMPRVEVLDARSGAHLGHVFPDGPRPTGKRYCINAAALRFVPEGEPLPEGPK